MGWALPTLLSRWRSLPCGFRGGFAHGGAGLACCKVGLDMAKPPREMLSVLLRSGDGRVVPTNQQEEIGMEATAEAPSAQTRKDYTSRPGALSRFFRMSRDGWKSKYKDLKATVKGYKNRLAHLTRSREQWRIRAERAVDRGSRGIRDQPRNPPKYTEKRIRINFPFPCPSRGQLPPVGWGRSVVTRL